MSAEHADVSELMGAYLLGALDESEATRLRAHLDGCPSCRVELASLSRVVSALTDADASALVEEPGPDAALAQRVVAELARQRKRQRSSVPRKVCAAVAAIVLAVAGFGLGIAADSDGEQAAAPGVPVEPVPVASSRPGVIASADLVDHTWGLEIKLTADGLQDGVRYRGTVRDADGHRHLAGAFQGVDDTTVLCNMTAAVLRDDAVAFVVRDSNGRAVLRSQL